MKYIRVFNKTTNSVYVWEVEGLSGRELNRDRANGEIPIVGPLRHFIQSKKQEDELTGSLEPHYEFHMKYITKEEAEQELFLELI